MTSVLLDPVALARAIAHEALHPEHLLPYACQIERDHPGYLASLGMTAGEYAAGLAEPGLTVDETVAAGLMSAAEGRYVQGRATRDDLIELGYLPEEIERIIVMAVRPAWREVR